ncbi:MAG: ABC transporter permease [Candidatus Cloacimonetes bacterium]|nr:ABC transporter permease [Candidatus Cloacimonadota bacterium]
MNYDFYHVESDTIHLRGSYIKGTIPEIHKDLTSTLLKSNIRNHYSELKIDGSQLTELDSSGVALLDEIMEILDISTNALVNFSAGNQKKINIFSSFSPHKNEKNINEKTDETFLYKIGDFFYKYLCHSYEMLVLTSDIFYWSIVGLFDKKGHRKGSFTQQSLFIGLNAIPIVCLLSFIIGLILSLQSAIQLRQFGADQFLGNLLGVALVSELAPLITAIIVAGRSGSAIASEIATMKVTEELDALKMMALNPIRYVVVPKFHAITVCMSILVVFSIIVGILGGLLVAVMYLGLTPISFINACISAVSMKTFVITLIKSTVFAWQIVIIGSHYGFIVQGGAEGVGKATTQSVVASIFGVIIMDALFSFLYLV